MNYKANIYSEYNYINIDKSNSYKIIKILFLMSLLLIGLFYVYKIYLNFETSSLLKHKKIETQLVEKTYAKKENMILENEVLKKENTPLLKKEVIKENVVLDIVNTKKENVELVKKVVENKTITNSTVIQSNIPKKSVSLPTEMYHLYVVSKGETIYSIAKRQYHDAAMYKKIIKVNPDLVDPNNIHEGQEVLLPIISEQQAYSDILRFK